MNHPLLKTRASVQIKCARLMGQDETHSPLFRLFKILKRPFHIPKKNLKADLMINATIEMLAALPHVIPRRRRTAITQSATIHTSLTKGRYNPDNKR